MLECGTRPAQPQEQEEEDALGDDGVFFSPPLYRQRYDLAIHLCRELRAKKMVDMGCAECRLLALLRREPSLEELTGVDIQRDLLETRGQTLRPLASDFVLRREQPLTITLLQGSISEPDQRLMDCDLMTCIEVIEHLDADVLHNVPSSLFGVLQPRVLLMTTPNADYNILFPNFTGFRHTDHRFEWTQDQFRAWCSEVTVRYPYSVKFGGVGMAPAGREGLGYCSQTATFTRHSNYVQVPCSAPYVTVVEYIYPHQSPLPPEQKLCWEAEYFLLQLLRQRRLGGGDEEEEEGVGEEGEYVRIPLKKLLNFKKIQMLCSTVEEIRVALLQSQLVTVDREYAVFDEEDLNSHSDLEEEDEAEEEAEEEEEEEEEDHNVHNVSFALLVKCRPSPVEENWDLI